jgi:hypothetical protein
MNLRVWWIAAIASISAYGMHFVHIGTPFHNDWYYFNSLSLVLRSIVLGFGQFPLHNPWVCGGLDLLANPQNRIFSPNFLLDLVFAPQWANLIGLCIYGAIGFFGAYKFIQEFGTDRLSSLVGSWIFVHGSWFGLHYAEGHIPFGSMQVLPLVFYLAMEAHKIDRFVILAALLSFIVLDGGIYAVIFSIFGILSLLVCGKIPVRKIFNSIKQRRVSYFGTVVGAILLALPKLYPVVASIGSRTPHLDFFQMPRDLILRSLFDPTIKIFEVAQNLDGTNHWRLHEFGCYLSWIGILVVGVMVIRRREFRSTSSFAVTILMFWLWVGSGLLPGINPWNLVHRLPLVNNAHVQSRVFILSFVFFCLLISCALSGLGNRPRVWQIIVLLLMVESVIIRNLPMWAEPSKFESVVGWGEIIGRSTIDRTVGEMRWTPRHYLANENIGSSSCYEPSFSPTNIRAQGSSNYRGEVWLEESDAGQVELAEYRPGFLTINYRLSRGTDIYVNTNALFGWAVVGGNAELFGKGSELLRIRPQNLSDKLELKYQPSYFYPLIVAFIGGIVLLLLIWVRSSRESK